jgi:hypothetical protein
MKGNPAVPGSPLTSKPTWSNTAGCSTTSAFFASIGTQKGRLIMLANLTNSLTPLFADYVYIGGGLLTLVVVVLIVLFLLRR